MKIIFFNPYCTFYGDTYVFYRASVPYNLLYLAAYLRSHWIKSKIFELGVFDESEVIRRPGYARCGISDHRIKAILAQEKPDIVGITTMYTVFHKDYGEIIKTIKEFNPKIHVVVGGNHASSFPDMMLEAGADQVVVGEGEAAFLDICRGDKNKIISREFVKELDGIPFPAYDLIDFRRYFAVNNPFTMRQPVAGIITSRGCPNDCVYCTANGVWQRKWRGRSPANIVAEMKCLVEDYDIREFHFLDDNIAVDRGRLENICKQIIEEKLNIKWATPNGIPYWLLDKPLLRLMKRSGCYRLTFGIESGDPETRKFIGKYHPLEKAAGVIRYANKIGLWTVTTNIVGFPYETEKQIQNTIDFAKACGTDFACFFTLLPHPSARVYQYFVKEGLFDKKDAMSALNEGGCRTVNFTKEQIKGFQKKAYNEFVDHSFRRYLRNPFRIFQKIRSFEDMGFVLKLACLGFSIKSRQGKKINTSKDFIYGKRQYV